MTQCIYTLPRWYRLRTEALRLFRYRCANCKANLYGAGKSAHVHHIIPVEVAPHLAFDLRNLKVLCMRCHNKVHGRGHGVHGGCAVDGSPTDPAHPWNAVR